MAFRAAFLEYAQSIFFNDDEEEENESVLLEKVDNYAELTVINMTDMQFKMHFRMSPNTFEDLLAKMHSVHMEDIENSVAIGHPRIPLEKETMIAIWCLSNLESFRSVADRFGISKSTCWDVLYRTLKLLLKVNFKFKVISWPTRNRQHQIAHHFNTMGFPGVIGVIDGSHIPIIAPKEFSGSYINRKNFHSVLLQGVCDHQLLFTDVYAGQAGSIHDYTLYKRSDLYASIQRNETVFYDDSHLIGDLAYKLNTNLIVGFKNNGRLTRRQKNYNYTLNKSRVVIENAFGILKGRFRRLKSLETVRLDFISLVIVSACILHNLCILNGDSIEIDLAAEVLEEQNNNPFNRLDIDEERENNLARIKRNNIVNTLPMIMNAL